MTRAGKPDFPPLLPPGRHPSDLRSIEKLTVQSFEASSRDYRQKLFYGFEEAIQALRQIDLLCNVCVDGSFLTENPYPSDVDVIVGIDYELQYSMTKEQYDFVSDLNMNDMFKGVDIFAYFNYPRGHEMFGHDLDRVSANETFGLENSRIHVKGYAILRLRETDVGLRICR